MIAANFKKEVTSDVMWLLDHNIKIKCIKVTPYELEGKVVCGMYGVCIEEAGNGEFEYLIADNYMPWNDIPNGYVTKVIPKHTWAVFSCKGPMPKALQETNNKIFSEWFPNCKEYEIAAGYNIELYDKASDYPKGTQDENYHSEIWIPVKRK